MCEIIFRKLRLLTILATIPRYKSTRTGKYRINNFVLTNIRRLLSHRWQAELVTLKNWLNINSTNSVSHRFSGLIRLWWWYFRYWKKHTRNVLKQTPISRNIQRCRLKAFLISNVLSNEGVLKTNIGMYEVQWRMIAQISKNNT